MLPFLWTFGFLSFLIVCGMCLGLYLYKQGIFGTRGYGKTRLYQTLVEDEESAVDESEVEPYTNVSGADAEASRYAWHGLLVFLGGLIVVVMLISSLLSAALH